VAEAHPEGTQPRWNDHQGTHQRGPEILILDASVTLAAVFPDERDSLASVLLDRIAVSQPVVPGHWILEVTNGLLIALRRGRLRTDEDLEIMDRLADLRVQVDHETPSRGWRETLLLARRFGLTTYDAAYLELAARRAAPLATTDTELVRAAGELGVAVAR